MTGKSGNQFYEEVTLQEIFGEYQAKAGEKLAAFAGCVRQNWTAATQKGPVDQSRHSPTIFNLWGTPGQVRSNSATALSSSEPSVLISLAINT
jgi:hypothetical protein